MIKSDILKNTIYPEDFTDEDKTEYDILYAQSKIVHENVEKENPFIIHLAVVTHIRAKKGLAIDFTDEELMKIKESYKIESKVFETKLDENHFAYDRENNIIYKEPEILNSQISSIPILEDVDN